MKIPRFAIITVIVLWITGFGLASLLKPLVANFLNVRFVTEKSLEIFIPNFSLAFSLTLCGIGAIIISSIPAKRQKTWSVPTFVAATIGLIIMAITGTMAWLIDLKIFFSRLVDFTAIYGYSGTLTFFTWGNWGVILITIIVSIILFINELTRKSNSDIPQEKKLINTPK